jgi:hypothetical protein
VPAEGEEVDAGVSVDTADEEEDADEGGELEEEDGGTRLWW